MMQGRQTGLRLRLMPHIMKYAVCAHEMNGVIRCIDFDSIENIFNLNGVMTNKHWLERLERAGMVLDIVIYGIFEHKIDAMTYANDLRRIHGNTIIVAGNSKKGKGRVICEETGQIFESAYSAALACSIHRSNMSNHLNRKPGYKTVRDLHFRYYWEENLKLSTEQLQQNYMNNVTVGIPPNNDPIPEIPPALVTHVTPAPLGLPKNVGLVTADPRQMPTLPMQMHTPLPATMPTTVKPMLPLGSTVPKGVRVSPADIMPVQTTPAPATATGEDYNPEKHLTGEELLAWKLAHLKEPTGQLEVVPNRTMHEALRAQGIPYQEFYDPDAESGE